MKVKKILLSLLVSLSLSSCMSHYEDLNGPDDYSLNTITDENIINRDIGSMGVSRSQSSLDLGNITISSMVKFSSNKFSGVYEVMYNNFFFNSSIQITSMSLKVTSGNFKMVVVEDDEKIIKTIEPSDSIDLYLDNLNGYISFRIAGESAAFELYISQIDFEQFEYN